MDVIKYGEFTDIAELAAYEAIKVQEKYKRGFASQHEFYGVLMEEVEELWDEIKKKETQYNRKHQVKEATQIIAVCMRFINQINKNEL